MKRPVEVGCLPAVVLSPFNPPAPPLGAVWSSHSVISLLKWLLVNILAMRPLKSSLTSISYLQLTHSLLRRGNRVLACIVRASETQRLKEPNSATWTKSSSADPLSRNIVLHHSHCVRVFQQPAEKCEAKFLLDSARLYATCDSLCKANTVHSFTLSPQLLFIFISFLTCLYGPINTLQRLWHTSE